MLKTDPKYGYFPWWPEEGTEWIHPDDVELARTMIPSECVFRREGEENGYVLMHYGPVQLRVHRTLWVTLLPEQFDLGDLVEVRSNGGQNQPQLGHISEMCFNPFTNRLEYQLEMGQVLMPKKYHAEELHLVEPIRPRIWTTHDPMPNSDPPEEWFEELEN